MGRNLEVIEGLCAGLSLGQKSGSYCKILIHWLYGNWEVDFFTVGQNLGQLFPHFQSSRFLFFCFLLTGQHNQLLAVAGYFSYTQEMVSINDTSLCNHPSSLCITEKYPGMECSACCITGFVRPFKNLSLIFDSANPQLSYSKSTSYWWKAHISLKVKPA